MIIGTHNSGSYGINKKSEFTSDFDSIKIKCIAVPWSRCQKLTIKEQLKCGVRYLDFRVGCHKNRHYLVHGLTGVLLEEAMGEINLFLDENPGEKVIVDFNHFYGYYDTHELENLVVRNLRRATVLWGKHPVPTELIERQVFLESKWPNCDNIRDLVEKLQSYSTPTGKMRVIQGIITPSKSVIVRKFFTKGIEDLAPEVNQTILEANLGPGIYLLDFVDKEICDKLLKLPYGHNIMFNVKRKRIDNGTSEVENLVAQGVSTFATGGALLPSITFSGDPNTGFYWKSADDIGISTGGTLRMDVSTSAVTSTLPYVTSSSTDSSSVSTGSIITSGGVGVAKKLYVGDQINETGTTDSSSVSTGSIVTAGGVGIAKNLVIGGYLRTPTSSLSITGGSATIGNGDSNVRLTGNTPLGGCAVSLPSASSNLGRTIKIIRSTGAGSYGVILSTNSSSDVFDLTLQSTAIAFLPDSKFNFSFTSLGLDPVTSKYIWDVNGTSEYSISRNVTGPCASTAVTITCYRNNELVTVSLPALNVAGNNTSAAMTIQAIPRDYWPDAEMKSYLRVMNNTTWGAGLLQITTSGVINIWINATPSNFTATTNDHGFWGGSFTYRSSYQTDV